MIAIEKQLLNQDEAAEFVDTKPQTLAAWRCKGTHDLPFVKVGRSVRYRRSDLVAWLERRTATCTVSE